MHAPLWTAEELLEAVQGRAQGPAGWSVDGIAIDSRKVVEDDLFIALAGPNNDGHDYVGEALANGAAAALVHRVPADLPEDAPLVVVEDTMEALTALGAAGRARSQARIVAITGSAGKTGTKEALKAVLSRFGKTQANVASFNNHWGVPLSLARLAPTARFGVFELGMNHAGEIGPLSKLVRPDVAVITTIGAAHLEHFANAWEIADAKAEIFDGLTPNGVAVLNRDNPYYSRLKAQAEARGVSRIISFGREEDAKVRLLDCALYARCSAVNALVAGEPIDFCLSLAGQHWVMNALAVLGAVRALGLDAGEAALGFATLKPLAGRGERHKIALSDGTFELIDDSYNANPDSMRAAFDVLSRTTPGAKGGRRIVVLGDMLELGAESADMHAGLAGPLQAAGVDRVYTCGTEMEALDAALPAELRASHAINSAQIAERVADAVRPGDVVLVKGSLGSRMARVVDSLLRLNQDKPPRAANGS